MRIKVSVFEYLNQKVMYIQDVNYYFGIRDDYDIKFGDYELSKDGRYKLRAYRKNQYQVALQGQIVETGVGFIMTIDYNKFKEIFQRSKDNKRRKKMEKANSSK